MTIKKDNKTIKTLIETFGNIMKKENIKGIAKKNGVDDIRERTLPVYNFVMLMILGQGLGKELSLSKLIETAIECGFLKSDTLTEARISEQVEERGYLLFKDIFSYLLEQALDFPRRDRRAIMSHFESIKIIDSTVISLFSKLISHYEGTRNNSALKVHVRYCYELGVPEEIKITEAFEHDCPHALYDTENSNNLYLMDLGYYDFEQFDTLKRHSDDFVVRVKRNNKALILHDLTNEHPEWRHKYLSFIEDDLSYKGELDLLVKVDKDLILRYVRVWSDKDKVYYRYYTSLKDNTLFSKEDIKRLYTCRWAIEIFFRDLKHVLGCIKIIFRTKERVKSQIYMSLCYYLLIRIFILISSRKTRKDISLYSVTYCSKWIRIHFVKHISSGKNISDFIDDILASIKEYGLIKHKKDF